MLTRPVQDEFLIAGDLTFHSVQWGERGSPIICVHGLTANAFCFQAFADNLARDHRVFAYDLRGRGDSDKPEEGYNVPIHTADLAALIDELELERPIVIGHSLGAFISLYFAANYPEKLSKLVLIDAGATLPWKTRGEEPVWLKNAVSRLGITVPSYGEFMQRLKAAPYLGAYWNEYLDIYFEHDVRRASDGSVVPKGYREGVFEDQLYLEEIFKPEEQWAKVEVPPLLLRAGQSLLSDDDQLVPEQSAKVVQHEIKNCHYINFPTLNHYTIVFGTEDGPAQEIRNFIEKE